MRNLPISPVNTLSLVLLAATSLSLLLRDRRGIIGQIWYPLIAPYALFVALCSAGYFYHGAGFDSYGALAELMAGFIIWLAVLCAWSAPISLYYLLVTAIVIAMVALCEIVIGHVPVEGVLNVNHYACLIAVALPVAFGLGLHSLGHHLGCTVLVAVVAIAMFVLLLLSKCRTALTISCVVMFSMTVVHALRSLYDANRKTVIRVIGEVAAIASVVLIAFAVAAMTITYISATQVKTLSAVGRTLIWRLALRIAKDNLWYGVGLDNFAAVCSMYEANYYVESGSSVPMRMAASQIGHAFSEPLELWAELGVWGGIIVIALGVEIARQAVILLISYARARHYEIKRAALLAFHLDAIALGMACAVLSFVLLSLAHFPRKVMPTFALFNVALAWVVRVNSGTGPRESKTEYRTWRWSRWLWLSFLGALCACACALTPYHVRRYLAARQWSRAGVLAQNGDLTGAQLVCKQIEGWLGWNGRFCAFQADLLLSAATDTNWAAPTSVKRAAELYEHAKYTYPDPYMFENLAVAYLRLADGTNWPVFVQTQYRMETPAQTLARKLREWRCGTNLFFEPPPTRLTQSDCIGRAIEYLTLASNILPRRLTSRWYLAQVYHDVGDVSNAVKYAQLVVNIPMKKDTPQGREFKRKAQKMLNELGVPCDDPGMVVFDIRDRKTWNEGRW